MSARFKQMEVGKPTDRSLPESTARSIRTIETTTLTTRLGMTRSIVFSTAQRCAGRGKPPLGRLRPRTTTASHTGPRSISPEKAKASPEPRAAPKTLCTGFAEPGLRRGKPTPRTKPERRKGTEAPLPLHSGAVSLFQHLDTKPTCSLYSRGRLNDLLIKCQRG